MAPLCYFRLGGRLPLPRGIKYKMHPRSVCGIAKIRLAPTPCPPYLAEKAQKLYSQGKHIKIYNMGCTLFGRFWARGINCVRYPVLSIMEFLREQSGIYGRQSCAVRFFVPVYDGIDLSPGLHAKCTRQMWLTAEEIRWIVGFTGGWLGFS